jgi:hypothetical protein
MPGRKCNSGLISMYDVNMFHKFELFVNSEPQWNKWFIHTVLCVQDFFNWYSVSNELVLLVVHSVIHKY